MTKAIEIEQEKTEKRIEDRFLQEMKESKNAPTNIMLQIATDEGYTLEGVRRMLIRRKVYPLSKSTDNDYDNKTNG